MVVVVAYDGYMLSGVRDGEGYSLGVLEEGNYCSFLTNAFRMSVTVWVKGMDDDVGESRWGEL